MMHCINYYLKNIKENDSTPMMYLSGVNVKFLA